MQRLTLIGLYNYDSSLFDNLSLPEEYSKDVFIEALLMEHGEKLVLYSDFDFMKYSIGAWSLKWYMELDRIADTLTAVYNPLYNYDRFEEWKDQGGKKGTSKTDSGRKSTIEGEAGHVGQSENTSNNEAVADGSSGHKLKNNTDYQDKQTNNYDATTSNITDGITEHQVSADNDGGYQPASKDITNVGSSKVANTGSITKDIKGTKDDISETNISETKSNESGNSKTNESTKDVNKTVNDETGNSTTADSEVHNSDHVGHIWGNIGVTTSSAMIIESVEMRMKYNLYNAACRLFANELLIGIY